MKIKAVLFDVDGVLYDDNKELIYYHLKAAEAMGLRIPTYVEVFRHFGRSWNEIIQDLWPGIDAEKYKKTWTKLVGNKLDEPLLNKGVKKTLEELKERFILGVVSGGGRDWVIFRFRKNNLLKFFDEIVAGDDTKKHKPSPEPILFACKKLNLNPKEVVYIGDNITDYESAKGAGVHFIGFIWDGIEHGFFDEIKLENRVKSFEEIPKQIEKIESGH